MNLDPYETTARDPLEETVPDPIERKKRLSPGLRRAVEACALLVMLPGLLVARWIDDSDQALQWQPREHVTVVRRGGTGTLGHTQWRFIGRDATVALRSRTTPAGAVKLTLLLEVRALDAQGVKDANEISYQVRDRAGHIWTGTDETGADDLVVGARTPVTVTATVPERLVSSVVLEAGQDPFARRRREAPVELLLFAH